MTKHLLQYSRFSAACSTMNTKSLISRDQVRSDVFGSLAHDISRWDYEVAWTRKQAVHARAACNHQKHCFPCKETPLVFRVHQLSYGTEHEFKKGCCICIVPSC